MKAIKTIRSHSGYFRFLGEVRDANVGFTKRIAGVPSPYRYSPEDTVYLWKNKQVFVRETSHRCYQVFEIIYTETRF